MRKSLRSGFAIVLRFFPARRRRRRGRDASDPTPPAQIPACGFSAPGSSVRRASAVPGLGGGDAPQGGWLGCSGPPWPTPGSCEGCVPPAPPSPWERLSRSPSPLRCSDSPGIIGRPLCARVGLPGTRNPWALPRSPRCSLGMPGPEDPARPASLSPSRGLCGGCRCVQTVAVCRLALTRRSQTSGGAVTLPASRVP